jgi:putative ABC transport system permease protein
LTGAGPQFYASARVTPGYFRTLNIPLLLGRGFDSLDASGKSKVAIVDETLGARLWPGESPIGRYLALNLGGPPGTSKNVPDWLEVIGVVGAVREPLSEGDAMPFLYTPNPALDPFGSFIVVRSRVGSSQLLQTLRDAVGRVDERVGVLQVRTLTSAIDDVRYPRRIAASLLGFSGLIGLVLAAIGLYGVVSYSVAQRLKELGIRAALGADRADIARLVVKEGVTTAAVGAGLGLIAAFILIRIASNQVMPMPIPDLTTLIVAPVLLGAVILIACYIPARRAARVEPMVVLRVQ